MVGSVEEVSLSLVREYLSRKGLKRTISCMDEEHPRTEDSINNRSRLREILNIEDLYTKNKVNKSPFKTLLEIIVNHHIEVQKNDKITRNKNVEMLSTQTVSTADSPAGTSSETNDIKAEEIKSPLVYGKQTKMRPKKQEGCSSQPSYMSLQSEREELSSHYQANASAGNSDCQKGQPLTAFQENNVSFGQRKSDINTTKTEATQRSRSNRIRRGMIAGPIPQESTRKKQSRRAEGSQPLFSKEEENKESQERPLLTSMYKNSLERSLKGISISNCRGETQELVSPSERVTDEHGNGKIEENIPKTRKVKTKPNLSALNVSELVLDDIDDDELQEFSKVSLQRSVAEFQHTGRPMDKHTATELKAVLLGSSLNSFSIEWRNQGFTFSETHDLSYGLVQRKGGPCGVLASIQAFVLKKLLFENTEITNTGLQRLRPSNGMRRQCLVLAMAEILWRAGEEKQATVAIDSRKSLFPSDNFRSDGVLEKIISYTVDNLKDLQFILEQHIEQFESGMSGCILLMISAVLSRSVEKVREDMDVPSNTLIGAHGYCTQELVNLLLCGRAVSNVFDNDMELDSGNGNMMLLKGIKGHCDVGLLSLFEHYDICKVGAYLKSPSYPIWVVSSESHFSVLFGLQRELLTIEDEGQDFDLYYYDGLANQQEEIRLTISVGNVSFQEDDTDLIPPLELCIRTRWKDASVNWNDTEPLL